MAQLGDCSAKWYPATKTERRNDAVGRQYRQAIHTLTRKRGTAKQMKRGLRTGGKLVKKRLRKTGKRSSVSNVARHRCPSSARANGKNARTSRDLKEALDQLAATSDMLRVISDSSGDLQPIFRTMLANALQICEADFGNIYLWDGKVLQLAASLNTPPAFSEFRARSPIRNPTTPTGRMIATKAPIHVIDLAAEKLYTRRLDAGAVAAVELGGVRTFLSVPMLKGNELVGAFILCRRETVRPFTDRQIALVTNFTAQAVIAIENARLFKELRQHTSALEKSLETLERERSNKLMNLEALAASISHEVRQPLTAIGSNGSAALRFLGHAPPNVKEAEAALGRIVADSHRTSQIFDNIRELFGKADRARGPVEMRTLADGALQVLRDELDDNKILTEVELTPNLPSIMGHKGQLLEVLINLMNNAIDAMRDIDGPRILKIKAQPHGHDAIVVSVEDSGTGIDPNNPDGIFEPFVTTKPAGMGLGLAICRMIIERHGGVLSAVPAHPCGSVFRVVLPTALA